MLLQAQIHKDAIENIKSQLNTIQAGIEPINIKIDTSGAIKAIKDIDGVTSKINTVTTKTWEDASGQVYKYTQTLKNLEKGLTIVDTYMKNTQGQLEYMGRTINDKSMEMNYKAIEKAHAEALKMNKALDDTIVKNHQLAKDTAWKQYFQSITETSDEIKKLNQYYKLLEDNRPMHVIHAEALKMNKAFDEQIAKAKTLKGVYTELKGEQQSASNVAKILSEAYGGLEIRGQSLNRVNGQYSVTLKQSAKENLVLKGAIDQVTGALYVQSESVSRARNIQMGFWEQMKEALKKVPIWMGATTVFFQSVRFVTGTIKEIKDLNKELIALERVTTASRIEIEAFYKQAPTAARQLGVLTSEVINTTAEISKLGYSLSEAQYLTRLGLVGKTVGDLDNVKDSVDYLTATVKGFRLEVEETESILDYMNHIANTTSINFRAIGEGFKRMSASLAEGGNTIQESMGMLVAGFDIVRNAELVATSLRTTSMRIRGVSEDGEDLSGLIPKLESKFNKFGLSLKKDNDTFKSTFEILKSISSVWKDLTDMERADLLEDLAGKRNVQTIAGIINNMKMAIDVSERFEESQGSAIIEHQRYMEGVEAAQNRFLSSMTELHNKLLQSDTIVWFYNFTSAIVDNISALGKWNIVILATTGLLFAFISATKKVILADTTLTVMSMGSAFSTLLTSLPGVIKGMFGLKSGIDATAASAGMLNIATGGIIIGIGLLAQGVGYLINRQKRLREEMEENLTAFQEQAHISKSLDSLIKSYEDLTKKINKTVEEQEKLVTIKEQIIALLPKAKNKIDNENLSLKEQVEILKELNKEELERAKNKARQAIIDYGKNYDKDVERLELVNMLIKHYNRELAKMDKNRHSSDFDAKKYEQLNKSLKKYTKESEELAERIETVDKAHEILDTTLEKTSRNVEDLIDNLDKYDSTLLDLESDINSLVKTLTELEEMQDKVASGYSYSYTEIQKIKEAYPELEDAIYRTAKGWSIEQSAIENLRNEQINQAETQMKAQVKMKEVAIAQTRERINEIIEEIGAVKNLATAYSLAAQLGQKVISGFGKTEVDMVVGSKNYEEYVKRMGAKVVGSTESIRILSKEQFDVFKSDMGDILSLGRDLEEVVKLESEIDKLLSNVTSGRVSGGAADKASKSAKSAKEEYQAIADLYLKINLELEKNNQLLARNKTMQELAVENSQEHFDLIRKENELYKERQNLLHQLANLQRAEMKALESELLVHGFTFTGEGDNRIITNLDNIKGKTKEVEEAFNRYIDIQSKLIPGLQQDWWDLQVSIVGNTGKIRDAIQALIEDLESLKDELEDFDFAEQMRDLNEQLETAKFTHWIENLILGFQRFNDQTELLQLKLSLFDEEDYQNRINVTAELYTASKDKLQAYKEEWNRLSAITPRNVEEANRIADAMKTVQQGMRDAFVATREYQREMKKIKVAAISKEFEKANKQLELQLSIIDHNIKSLQDGILPDFSLEMIMPIPDFTDIFNETASENEKLYKEHLGYEEQILELKQKSLAMQLQDAERFYREEVNKLMNHYTELISTIAEKEQEIAELRRFADEKQEEESEKLKKDVNKKLEENHKIIEKLIEDSDDAIEKEKLEHYKQLLEDMGIEWFKSEKDEITTHYGDIESITTIFLTNLAGEYDTIWDRIVTTVRESVKAIKSYIASVDSSVSSVSGSGVSGSSPLRVKVNPDGNAPKGLSPGTIVETAGGDYRVIGVRPDGSYESEKIKKRATGGIIEKRQDVLVGEEGFEIGILPSGKTILFGKHGSELVNIPEGTTIIPHEESKDIVEFTGNIDGKKIPKYKDGAEGAIPKYALGLIGAVVGAGLASGILKNIVGSSKKEEPVDVKVVEIKDDNRYYAPITPTREPSLHDLIGIETPDFFTEMSREFKRGSGKYSEGVYDLLGFKGYDKYLKDRKISLTEIRKLQEEYLNNTDDLILKEEILAKIDKQLLEDARTQSWLRVDLLEQMQRNVEEYSNTLKEKYDEALASSDTELARQIFEEYNASLTQQLQIEQQIQQAIKQRYDMEFALLDRHIAKQKQYQSSLEKTLELITITDSENKEEILRLNDEIIKSEIEQRNILRDSIAEFSKQLDLLPVGSSEWNILNDKVKEYEINLIDANIAIEKAIIQRYDTEFSFMDKALTKIDKYIESLEYQRTLLEELAPDNLGDINVLNKNILSSITQQVNLLDDTLYVLKEQIKLLEVGSNEWNIINNQIDNVISKIRTANLELIRLARTTFTAFAGDFKERVEGSIPSGGGGGSSSKEEPDDSDKYLEGREKELEILKLRNYAEEHNLTLNAEQLKILNSSEKIRKRELDIIRKELEFQQLQIRLDNLRNQQTIQQLTKLEDGTWDFVYTADIDEIRKTEQDLIDAELNLIHARKDLDKELKDEQKKATESSSVATESYYSEQLGILDDVLSKAEKRVYKSAEEFRSALLEIGLNVPAEWIEELVDEYWEYFLITAEIFIKEALEKTKEILKQQSESFAELGNELGQNYVDGLLDSIDKILAGDGDIVQKQKAIIDMLAGEYAEFALAGNKVGMGFVQGLIDSMGTVDYELEFNDLGNCIKKLLEEQSHKLLEGGQEIGSAFVEGLLKSIDEILEDDGIPDKTQAILDLLDQADEYGTLGEALGESFAQGLSDILINMVEEVSGDGEGALSEVLNTMIKLLDERITDFAEKGDIQGLAYAEALRVKLQEALKDAKLTQTDIIDLLSEFKDFDLAGLLSGKAYDESLTEGLGKAEDNVDKSSSAIIKGLDEDVEKFGDVGKAQGEAYKNAIVKSFENAVEKAKSIVGDLVKYINSQSFNIDVSVDGKTPDGIQSFDSGGYTGRSQGLAWLDEKELILNKIDTSNLLKAIDVTRDLFSNSNALSVPQLQTASAGSGGQVFHIDKLEFPNVRDAREIEGAIKNLSTYATQWANRN